MSITFKRLDKDTGILGQASSIQPVENGDFLVESVLQRPSDNLRVRTEELARAVESLEYLFQSVSNSSILLRSVIGGTTLPSLLKVYSKTFNGNKAYYVLPSIPLESSATLPSLVILGSATNTFSYIVNEEGLSGFYNQGTTVDNHNYTLGLSSTGDTLCLRIPTVSSTYTSEVLLPQTTSALDPAGESSVDSNLRLALINDHITVAEMYSSVVKIPSKNSILIPSTVDATFLEFLQDKELEVGVINTSEYLKVRGYDSSTPGSTTSLFTLDLNGIVSDGSGGYIVPNAGYRDFEALAESSIDTFEFFISQDSSPDYTETTCSIRSETLLPKNEFLYPLAVHTGDSILIPGLGGVRITEIEAREGEALIDSSGTVIGELGTSVSTYNTRSRIKLKDLEDSLLPYIITEAPYQYFRLPIDTSISEAGLSTPLYLRKLELHLVLDEQEAALNDHIDPQVIRDVQISIGLFNIDDSDEIDKFKSSGGGVFNSLLTCVPGKSDFNTQALPRLILSNFPLTALKDDYSANVELLDSIRNTNATGNTVIVWIYRANDNQSNFFTNADRGSINLDLRFTWETRLADSMNLASEESLAKLGHT